MINTVNDIRFRNMKIDFEIGYGRIEKRKVFFCTKIECLEKKDECSNF